MSIIRYKSEQRLEWEQSNLWRKIKIGLMSPFTLVKCVIMNIIIYNNLSIHFFIFSRVKIEIFKSKNLYLSVIVAYFSFWFMILQDSSIEASRFFQSSTIPF